jgi:hypothetical protein
MSSAGEPTTLDLRSVPVKERTLTSVTSTLFGS